MSAYIIFNIFFAIILFFAKKGWARIFYGAALATMIFLLLAPPGEPTQGAIGAFFGGIILLVVLYFICYSIFTNNKKLRNIVLISVAIFIIAGSFFSQTAFFKGKVEQIMQSSSWQSRMIVWKMGIETWLEKPWFGWGEENFNKGFAKHYDPALSLTNDLWYDRAHNIVVDQMVSFGTIGLLSYVSIFAVAVISLFKACSKLIDKRDIIVPLGLISLLAVYFVQNIWVFDMVASYLMFFTTLGLIYFFTSKPRGEVIEEKKYKKPYIFAFSLLIILALSSIYWCNIRPLEAAHYIVKGRVLPIEESIVVFGKGMRLSLMSLTEGSEQFSIHMSELLFSGEEDKSGLIKGFLESEKGLKEAIEKNPNNFRLYLTLGKHYNNFYNLTKSVDELDSAREALNRAKELSPRNQQVYWEIAQNELYRGNREKSIEYLNESINLEPGYNFSYWYLGLVYRVLGENESAWENMKIAKDKGFDWNNSLNDLIKVISVNQALLNHQDLIPLYDAALKLDPRNAKLAGGMSLSYANIGEYQKASEMAKFAVQLDPSLKDDLQPIIDLWK
jgi:tetratricopeptide (TPR) repeat protein